MKSSTPTSCFGNICRICRLEKEKIELISIFNDDDLLDKITSFLPITVHKEDSLPHDVCDDCIEAINNSFQLVTKAITSESYFLKCLKREIKVKIEATDSLAEPEENSEHDERNDQKLDLHGSVQCDICEAKLSASAELDNHIQENHINQSSFPPNTEFTLRKICSLCGQLFDNDEVYVLHKYESHQKCSLCSKTMPTKCLLNRHIQHSCKQLYYCPHCHKTFTVKNFFMKHVEAHSGEDCKNDSWALEIDGQENRFGDNMEHTYNQITEDSSMTENKFKCYICGQAYKRKLNLVRHCLQHEPKTDWKFKCHKCDDVFEKEKKLHIHCEKVHKMSRTWVCRFCGKALATKLSVQIHERIHTQVKPYVCEWCGNAFRSKANLSQHHAKHTGIRRHKCPVCGKMFSRTFFLRVHLRVHTGERPYQCEICDQRFTQVGDMRRHRKRHDKPSNQSASAPAVIIVRRANPPPKNTPSVVTLGTMPIETVIETSQT